LIDTYAHEYLDGGSGNDTLTDGVGADIFVLNAPRSGIDRLNDFTTSALYFDADGSLATNAAVQIATIVNLSALTASNFLIV
jgi:Ca2+-binding RTX toxin-like protein